MRDGSGPDNPAPETEEEKEEGTLQPVTPDLDPKLLGEASEKTFRPVIFEDLGRCCGSRCNTCYGKGYVTYLQGKAKGKRPCTTGMRKFQRKHGNDVEQHEGMLVWKPKGLPADVQTTPQENPLRDMLQSP